MQYFAEIAQNPESNQSSQNNTPITSQLRQHSNVWTSNSNIKSERDNHIQNKIPATSHHLDNNRNNQRNKNKISVHHSQQPAVRMDDRRDRRLQGNPINRESWNTNFNQVDQRNNFTGHRPGNGRMNVAEHHVYAAVPARVRATSSDDRSVGSLVSLHSESSATSGSNSANNNLRKNQTTESSSNEQSNLLAKRKQSIDDSVNSDTRTLCDLQDLNKVPTAIDISSINVPSPNMSYNQGLIPIVTTELPSSPIDSSSPDDGKDQVVPAPVLNRIKKDCELKEEFLKRPNLPNYLAPPTPQTSSHLNIESSFGDNNCETPVLPPLASPEIDILTSPQHKAIHAASGQHHPGSPAIGREAMSTQNYSPSQHIPQNNVGFQRSHVPNEDRFSGTSGIQSNNDPHLNVMHGQEESSSSYERPDIGSERPFSMESHSQGRL